MSRYQKPWWLFLTITVFLFLLAYFGETVNPALQYQREAIKSRQWWRLISAHFVHLNINHFLINWIIFTVAWMLISNEKLKSIEWLITFSGIALFCSLGLYLFSPDVITYVGLSGILHGILLLVLLDNVKKTKWYFLPLGLLLVKIILEQLPSYDDNYMQSYIGAKVITDAHLYGAIAGLLYAVIKGRRAD